MYFMNVAGVPGYERPRRPVRQQGPSARSDSVVLPQRHRAGARRAAGPLPGKRGAQGMTQNAPLRSATVPKYFRGQNTC